MKSSIPKVRLGFLIAFGVLTAAIAAYEVVVVWPAEKCEAKGDWWDPEDRVCAVPMPISHFTGRKIGDKLVVTAPPCHPGTPCQVNKDSFAEEWARRTNQDLTTSQPGRAGDGEDAGEAELPEVVRRLYARYERVRCKLGFCGRGHHDWQALRYRV